MAANLTMRKDGMIEFAYRAQDGEAWHRSGQAIGEQDVDNLHVWTKQAGMDWTADPSAMTYYDPTGNLRTVPDKFILMRSDTGDYLGDVSDRYHVVQPSECLEFFRDFVGVGGMKLSAAGTLDGGRRFWATAKITDIAPVSMADRIGMFVLMHTSCDGSKATEIVVSSVRAVCQNTIAAAQRKARQTARFSHKRRFDAEQAKSMMGLLEIDQTIADFEANMIQLANTPISVDKSDDFLVKLLQGSMVQMKSDDDDKVRASAAYRNIMNLFKDGAARGSDMEGVRGTAYGMLNAVTEYSDHYTRARSAEARFANAQWGQTALLKDNALDMLLTMPSRTVDDPAASNTFASLLDRAVML